MKVSEDADVTTDDVATATYLIPLIERWMISLAWNQATYDNVDVMARTRCKAGEPGLSVNASASIRKVQSLWVRCNLRNVPRHLLCGARH